MKRYSIRDVVTGKVKLIVRDLANGYALLLDARFHTFVRHAHQTGTLELHQSVGQRDPGSPTRYGWALVHVCGIAPDGTRTMATFEPGTNEVSMKEIDAETLDFLREQTVRRKAEERALQLVPA